MLLNLLKIVFKALLMNNIYSIAIITCWYGDYPWYLPYFIKSCAFNPFIDFIIITDNENEINNKPENVKVIFKTINDIKVLSSEKLGFEVNIDYPYKLCDLNLHMDLFFLTY